MSFLIGPSPIRRTLNYLRTCPLMFREQVKIVEYHYNMFRNPILRKPISDTHVGLREFFYWYSDPIQYNNKSIQFVRFTDINPLPFIRCWLDTGEDVLFDCDLKSKEEIMNQLVKTLGKSKKDLEGERIKNVEAQKENPAIFGFGKERFCMCEIEGQVPCSGVVELPKSMQSKYYHNRPDELEAYENDPNAQQWNHEYIRNRFWNQFPLTPQKTHFKGIERLQFGKLPTITYKNHLEKYQKTYFQVKKEKDLKKRRK